MQILALILIPFFTNAQQTNDCSTPEPDQQVVEAYMQSLPAPTSNWTPPYALPIHLFIIRDDNGYHPTENIIPKTWDAINKVNEKFTNGMSFYLCNVTEINNSQYYQEPSTLNIYNYLTTQLGFQLNEIFVVINNNNTHSNSTYPWDNYHITHFNSAPPSSLLAHELGHYFGLMHTFDNTVTSNTNELIFNSDCECIDLNSSGCYCHTSCNCSNIGDAIADTPVDPGIGFCSIGNQSPCVVTLPDNSTLEFYPDLNNIMSSYNPTSFTAQQLERMLCILENESNLEFLIDNHQPTCDDFDFVILADEGKVSRVYYDQATEDWMTEPLPEARMNVKNNLETTNCIHATDNQGKFPVLDCLSYTQEIDATAGQFLPGNTTGVFKANNGVTIIDILNIRKHILSIQYLPKPYSWIAADVSNNGLITTTDLAIIQKIILGQIDAFPNAPSWRMFPAYYLDEAWDFQSDFFDNPFSATIDWQAQDGTDRSYLIDSNNPSYLDDLHLVDFNEDLEAEDTWSFFAIKSGDVNYSAQIQFDSPEESNTYTLTTSSHDCLETSETATLKLKAQSNEFINGYQLGIKFDDNAFEIQGVNKGNISPFMLDYFNIEQDSGRIRALWFDPAGGYIDAKNSPKTLFEFQIKAKDELCNIASHVFLRDSVLLNSFYDTNDSLSEVDLYLELIPEGHKHHLDLVYPNPSTSEFTFNFSVGESSSVTLVLQDSYSNTITHSDNYAKGDYQYSFTNTNSLQQGILTYVLTIGNEIFSGNLIKL